MDAFRGRSQTTKGIWIARAVSIVPCTVIMDLEGTDGRERGEDDTAFEKQSALFDLAVSDIVLINMNPLYLLLSFVIFLLAKAVWVQMDIVGEFRSGALPGLLSITSRFLPTVMNLLRRLAEEDGGHPQAHEEPRRPQSVGSHSFRNHTHKPNSVSGSIPASSVASTVSSSESGTEYSSPQLTRRRVNNVEQVELS